ncbi:MAG TPA: cytochrome c [Geopsychrobacteraceae bacterium]|nr:cytochrome c [Geopsychrobacteraceae bacterium]
MFKILIFLAVLSLSLSACREDSGTVPERDVPRPFLAQKENIVAGQELFHRLCRECHGTLVEGRNQRAERFVPPAPDFHEDRYAQSDPAYLFWRIEEGKRAEPFRSRGSVMPSWKPHLSDEQIWQIVAYLKQRSLGNF